MEQARVSVDKEALDALVSYADDQRMSVDLELCGSPEEHEASEAKFRALTERLEPREA